MRIIAAAAIIAACMLFAHVDGAQTAEYADAPDLVGASIAPAVDVRAVAKQTGPAKPEGRPATPQRQRGNDTCRWANDNECDDPDIGTGACALNTDYSDCRRLRNGEDDSCRWARDGECDEPQFGTGACVQGSDRTDCGDVAWLRNQTDRCDTAFNGVCEEPGRGSGSCEARSDRSDCFGRQRPTTINDHFFGNDDRVLVNVREAPWRFMGSLNMDTGATCTATLIARDVLITAAHCIHSDNRINAAGRFTAAGGQSARIIAYQIDPRFNYQRFMSSDDLDGLDWALLRIDRPLGDQLGFAGLRNLTGEGQRALTTDLMQAGYSWDTGDNLSGNLACRIATVYRDNTFAHRCDTTRGDSGSAFVVRNGAGFDVIGVDSSFRSNPSGPFLYIAVSAAGFMARAPDFIAGRTGTNIGAANRPGRGIKR